MFEEILLFGQDREKIEVQTRRGFSLDNFIAAQASAQHSAMYAELRKKHGSRWIPRKNATGTYNCVGLVWASRRTSLSKPSDWEQILLDDGYRPLNQEEPMEGDVAVYRVEDTNEITHVARVCIINRLTIEGKPHGSPLIWAISKWGSSYGEDIHRTNDVFLDGGTPYRIEYYTDRS